MKVERPEGVADRLKALFFAGKNPEHRLIWECFPTAVTEFGRFSALDPLAPDLWPVKKVRPYWRQHVGFGPGCEVQQGLVIFENGIRVRVDVAGEKVWMLNQFSIPVKPGFTVYCHQRVIAEVVSGNRH